MTSLKRTENLIDTNKAISVGKRYLQKLSRGLLYKNKSYTNPLPTKADGDDLQFRIQSISDWDQLNAMVKGLKTHRSEKITPLSDPFLGQFLTSHEIMMKSFQLMKDYIKDRAEQSSSPEEYDPSQEPLNSPDWCVSRLFDLSRSLVTVIDKKITYSKKETEVEEGDMMAKQIGVDTSFGTYFRSLKPILENMNDPERNIVYQVQKCQESNVYKNIFRDGLSRERSFQTPSELNTLFNKSMEIGLSTANSIQQSVLTDVGTSIYNAFLEKNL